MGARGCVCVCANSLGHRCDDGDANRNVCHGNGHDVDHCDHLFAGAVDHRGDNCHDVCYDDDRVKRMTIDTWPMSVNPIPSNTSFSFHIAFVAYPALCLRRTCEWCSGIPLVPMPNRYYSWSCILQRQCLET